MRFGKFIALATVFVAAFTLGSCSKDDEEKEEVVENNPKFENREYVDLGLPSGTLWAACNVGANKPEEYGNYFAWGETEQKETSYDWDNYKFLKDGELTKYRVGELGEVSSMKEILPEDDAATVNWSSSWRMPSLDQIKELINSDYTTTEFTTLNDIKGLKITSKKNGKTLFFPAGGSRNNKEFDDAGIGGAYWSCSYDSNSAAYAMEFGSSDAHYECVVARVGFLVRPVLIQK